MKKNYTHIVLLIDRSGSMINIKKDMEGGLADFIAKQKLEEGECTITTAQFDTGEVDYIHKLSKLNEVKEIKIDPRGGTALIDSMVKVIEQSGKELAALDESQRPERVLFITITDGEENSSREFTNQQLAERIKHQEENYKWEFVYIGANQNAFDVARQMGVSNFEAKSMNYSCTSTGTAAMFSNLSSATTRYRSATNTSNTFAYTAQEQQETENA